MWLQTIFRISHPSIYKHSFIDDCFGLIKSRHNGCSGQNASRKKKKGILSNHFPKFNLSIHIEFDSNKLPSPYSHILFILQFFSIATNVKVKRNRNKYINKEIKQKRSMFPLSNSPPHLGCPLHFANWPHTMDTPCATKCYCILQFCT